MAKFVPGPHGTWADLMDDILGQVSRLGDDFEDPPIRVSKDRRRGTRHGEFDSMGPSLGRKSRVHK